MKLSNKLRFVIKKHQLRWLQIVLIGAAFFVPNYSYLKAQDKAKTKSPNLVIVYPDQWRGSALGFLGEEPVQTPNIDRFASQSLVLTDAIANYAVCSPSRAMLMTGQYPITNGVLGNAGVNGYELKKSAQTWSDVLSERGYSLGYIGKWHLDTPKKPYVNTFNNLGRIHYGRTRPYKNTYDTTGGINGNGWTPPDQRHGFKFWYAYGTYDRHMKPIYWSTYVAKDDWFYVNEWEPKHDADVAIKYIKNKNGIYRDPNAPFALMVAMNPPHMPYDRVPKKYQKIYEDIPMDSLTQRPNIPPADTQWGGYYRDKIKNYYAMMSGVDEQFGRILQALKENGMKDNTIVLFTSDHGNQLGIHKIISKNQPYEESVQIPFIIRYPGHIPPGRDSLLLSIPDIYPTLLDLMGIKNQISEQVEGESYAQIFTSGDGDRPDYQLYMRGGPKYGLRGLRTHRYTFVMNVQKKGFVNGLLFDRKRDPYQMDNLYNSRPRLVNKFKKKLKQVLLKRNDPWVRHLK